ncbi:Protein phosphatase 1 regulatory subunit 42 [Habropoda laboriosa]|uniref:Protein phosphatase 1 regulatory subunit 42 n=1 Tax=Habropoda laboriosa TaxID=597456 RepID=A0A0L7RGV9_9HYME|nr:PREDICTED: protein phosphatase 1 regulatory subunit 42-like [Habropoda laboriosa]KOC70095.1 Protein phosphatase 1 regulatory subunit 42 [Habropoda laboriosa]
MVRLTAEYIEKKCSQIQLSKSLSKKIKKDQLYNITHLRMNNMFISSIGNCVNYKNLKVIYLQNNNIATIENLHFASNLTHLYLQHNVINKIENLDFLENLHTLYLGYNKIPVVEGLERLKNLTILQIENQKLPIGESLCFDPRSILTLSKCLKVLNISGNKIISLKSIRELNKLEVLDAEDNFIEDINDLTESINVLTSLTDLSLQGNPVTQCYRYKENIIANNDTIKTIDRKTVTDVCRCFMKRFKIKKHLYHTKKSLSTTLDEDIASSLNLPPAFKKSISRAIFQHPNPKFPVTISSVIGETHVFPPWKIAPGANALRNGHFAPRPFWSNIIRTKQPRNIRSLLSTKAIKLPPI